jgi:hypothetical protein
MARESSWQQVGCLIKRRRLELGSTQREVADRLQPVTGGEETSTVGVPRFASPARRFPRGDLHRCWVTRHSLS